MTRTQTMVQLTDDLIGRLDHVAADQGISRSALIRRALSDYLDALRAADVGTRIVAGYTKVPPSTPDVWGTTDRPGDVGTSEVLARMDDEERRAGHQPW